MFWQREVLRDAVSMTFNQTFELDLPKSGILGSLGLYLSSTQNGQPFLTAVKWRLVDYISKVEIVGDGAEVIKSYDGRQALAAGFFDQGVEPVSQWRHYSNTPHRQDMVVNFGRELFDEIHALDLERFDQVKLKITNDATSTEFTTDIKATVLAYWLREATVKPVGYYREEEWKTWAPVAAAVEYSDLPTALKIRRILLRARPGVDTADAKNNSSMLNLMSDVDFTLRTGQTRAYKGSLQVLGRFSVPELGRYAYTMTNIDRTDEYGYESGIGYVTQGVKSAGTSTATPVAGAGSKGAGDVNDSAQEIQLRVADEPLEGIFRGYGYMHNVALFNSQKADDGDVLDPEAYKVVKVDITCASGTTVSGTSAAAQNAIVLSRLVPA